MSVRTEVEEHGYALLRSFIPAAPLEEVAGSLGEVERVDGLRLVQELVPKVAETSTPNTYSGNFGYGEFPLHTDLAHWATPPRYLILRCLVGDPEVSTRLIDSTSLIESIGVSSLARCITKPRRPLDGTIHLLPLLHRRHSVPRPAVRWDSLYLRPANFFSASVFDGVQKWLAASSPSEQKMLDCGDTLVIDNWRMLHGRSTVNSPLSNRRIQRVYLSGLR